MSEKLSDDRLRWIATDDVSAITIPYPETQSMAFELIVLRERVRKLEALTVWAADAALLEYVTENYPGEQAVNALMLDWLTERAEERAKKDQGL